MGFEDGAGREGIPTELPGEWVDMSGEIVRIRAGQEGPPFAAKPFTIPRGHAEKSKFVGKYNFYEGTMIVGAPDGSMRATPYSREKEHALKKAGYKKVSVAVPSLLEHYRFDNEETQRKFEALK